jgi:ABC-type multidrug transport system fused ATPase/permease subunit
VIILVMTRKRVFQLGLKSSVTEIESRVQISETLSLFREIAVKNRQGFFLRKFSQSRFQLADVLAQNNFMPFASKYIVESTIIMSALLVAAVQFLLSDAVSAVSTLAIFLAAATRIAPAVLRLQQSAIQINSGMGIANSTLMLINELSDLTPVKSTYTKFDQEHGNFEPRICIRNLTVSAPDKSVVLLRDVSLEISQGSRVGIVGASGAGKTTLVDLLLGLNTPTSGEVQISGKSPRIAINIWPGSIAYVPQDVHLANGTIKENIALGYSANEVEESQIFYALELSGLSKFVNSLPNGLNSLVGDNGISLSGGQKQRIGLARALISKPKLLVLDEATSALDSQSEFEIAESIRNLGKEITVIVVAHRLSTIRDFERILYLKDGSILAEGTFEEVRRMVKEFDEQATLMGF